MCNLSKYIVMHFPLYSGRFADPHTNYTRRFSLFPGDSQLILIVRVGKDGINWTICEKGECSNSPLCHCHSMLSNAHEFLD